MFYTSFTETESKKQKRERLISSISAKNKSYGSNNRIGQSLNDMKDADKTAAAAGGGGAAGAVPRRTVIKITADTHDALHGGCCKEDKGYVSDTIPCFCTNVRYLCLFVCLVCLSHRPLK